MEPERCGAWPAGRRNHGEVLDAPLPLARDPLLPAPSLTVDELETLENHFSARDLRVDTYSCALAGVSFASPFRPAGYKICLPRTGVCGIGSGREELLSDATKVLLLDPQGTYAVRHLACDCRRSRVASDRSAPVQVCGTVITLSGPIGARLTAASFPTGRAVQLPSTAEIALLHAELVAASRGAPVVDAAVERLARELVDVVCARATVAAGCRRRAGTAGERLTAAAIESLFAADLGAPWSLATLAAALGCSQSYLCRSFWRTTGSTIHRHLVALRLGAATQRLAAGAEDLGELALELGFASHCHFTNSFRRRFGTTPSRFRQRLLACGRRPD